MKWANQAVTISSLCALLLFSVSAAADTPEDASTAEVPQQAAGSQAAVLGVESPLIYGQTFDKGRKLTVDQWRAVMSMVAYPENGTTHYQAPTPWRYCEVDYEARVGIALYRGDTFGPAGITTVGDFPLYFKRSFAPMVLGVSNASNADMRQWAMRVTGLSAAQLQADDEALDPYPGTDRRNPAKRVALHRICTALQQVFDRRQNQYVRSLYDHSDRDKLAPTLAALAALGFTQFDRNNLAGLAYQVQVNTGSIGSIASFDAVRKAGDCGGMSSETCFATYLTDQYIRWLKSPNLGDDGKNCWRANMALDFYKQDPAMANLNTLKHIIQTKYQDNSGKCPVSGIRWSVNMRWK